MEQQSNLNNSTFVQLTNEIFLKISDEYGHFSILDLKKEFVSKIESMVIKNSDDTVVANLEFLNKDMGIMFLLKYG